MGKKSRDVKSLFFEAIEKSSLEEKIAFLDEFCGKKTDLRQEVEALLELHEKAGDFLEVPPVYTESSLVEEYPGETEGTVIGRYKLLERIGEGGMATVYMAEQEQPIRRQVALKIIKLGMDTKQVIARFEVERQALALMDHPNIARVFDAGASETGRPYFAMELVRGLPITEYCDKNDLTTQQRLELFTQVCHAVQHAHQKGIIHRDIKPSNIMVALHDGKAVPKVIDFGIAKATERRLTEKTLFTQYAQLIGTPEYMSPEQAEWSDLNIDTRTDIYSLGVLLYELLTGTTPFDAKSLREAGYSRMQKIICEQEPTRPSTKLSGLGETLAEVAKHRKTSPDNLRKLLRGDLDWIVMKALEKDRIRRYETAVEFGADITRYRNHEPVIAAAPSTLYKLRKFVRRNRAAVTVGFAMAVILIAGITTATIGFLQASKQRNLALTNFEKARNSVDEMVQVSSWLIAGASTPELAQSQLTILKKGEAFYQEYLADNPGDPQMWENFGSVHKNLGEKYFVLGDHERSEFAYRKVIEIFERLKKDFPDRDDYDREIACGWSGLSYALSGQGKEKQAKEAKQECLQLWQPTQVRYRFGTPVNPGRPFNTEGMDGTPSQRADGLEMFFGSDRSGHRGDIWVCQRTNVNEPWSEPVRLGPVINTENYEGKPCVSGDGLELIFTSERNQGYGSCDLWAAKRTSNQDSWGEPENLGPIVNSSIWEGTPCLAEEGFALYFESDREGSLGSDDLWMAKRASREEPWGKPVNLGPLVNSPHADSAPYVSRDGLLLLFASSRPVCFGGQDLWMATRKTVNDSWSQPVLLGPMINSLFVESHPYISFDSALLYLAIRDHPDGLGHWDMWQVAMEKFETADERR